ncbi:peptidylprolyl isomerase [Defluviimonas sp. WL0024]|uniref:Parvulin-like PPIase n=1 Tax=Albidovulum salinarum TaxID=2984153 RepID=A0ABT2XA06_9RHOB|nr:peptidylprolyl isomerase [Defluviimonas sp. WL0024]MCU9849862.1 peptidylprolyl isomerase [Defluviimonas sp. WL0024]
MKRAIKEPLLHFTLIGALLFWLYDQNNTDPKPDAPNVIDISASELDRLSSQFRGTWNRAPTTDELAALIDGYVRDEVYYREALALGLDQDDAVIRQRLRLKMEFLTAGVADSLEADGAALAAYYEANKSQFTRPPQVTFRQVMLAEDDDPDEISARLASGTDPMSLGRPSLLPNTMENAQETAVDGTFGSEFFARISAAPAGVWTGPVPSAYGYHLVHVDEMKRPAAPELSEIREQVEQSWRHDQAEALLEGQYRAFLSSYEVRMPETGSQ